MKFHFYLIIILLTTISSWSQSTGYTAKKEFGFKGNVKKVTTYSMLASPYRSLLDTTKHYSKNTLYFSKAGDLVKQEQNTDINDYTFLSFIEYKGTGKNISYTERYKSNSLPLKKITYKYQWENALSYKIISTEDIAVKAISLNSDFTIKTVSFDNSETQTFEEINYEYDEYKNLIATKSTLKTTKNNLTTTSEDTHKVQQYDVYNNPTVVYYFKDVTSTFPNSIIIKYYEYY